MKGKNMKAFHNKVSIKNKYLKRVIAHQKADELVKGETGGGGKGCAVWCTLDKYEHAAYPVELGIPEWLARVEDTLFEGMTLKKSKTWPEKFLKAIKPGVDLEKARVPFLVMVLEHSLVSMDKCKYDAVKWPQVKAAIDQSKAAVTQMIEAQKSGDNDKIQAAYSACLAAYSAAYSARSAARSARSAARSAAYSAYSAYSAAYSAHSASHSAAYSAYAAYSAAYSAGSAAHDYFADELIKILKGIKRIA
jgi:hypothetical protein